MAFSVPAYGASNSKVKGVASGFDHAIRTGDNTFDIYFTDGSKVSLTIPLPKEVDSVEGGTVSGTIVVKYSDGTKSEEIPIPTVSGVEWVDTKEEAEAVVGAGIVIVENEDDAVEDLINRVIVLESQVADLLQRVEALEN